MLKLQLIKISNNVAGMKIEGTQGDTNNMPQWIGKILSENKIGTLIHQI